MERTRGWDINHVQPEAVICWLQQMFMIMKHAEKRGIHWMEQR